MEFPVTPRRSRNPAIPSHSNQPLHSEDCWPGGTGLTTGSERPGRGELAAAPFGNLGGGATVEQFPGRILGVECRQAESGPDREKRDLKVPAA